MREAERQYLDVPSEYTPVEDHIDYAYEFSEAASFHAQEQPDGTVKISIDKDGKESFDFSSLLPAGYKFVSYPYVANMENDTGEDITWIGWYLDKKHKHIQIDDFESPADLIAVLHEVGHAVNTETEKKDSSQDTGELLRHKLQRQEFDEGVKQSDLSFQKELARAVSKSERSAWAYALKTLKKLEDDLGIDLRNIFKDEDSVREFINKDLSSYREDYEWLAKEDPEFSAEIIKLFDKAKRINNQS